MEPERTPRTGSLESQAYRQEAAERANKKKVARD
jgi:hypothetical protein